MENREKVESKRRKNKAINILICLFLIVLSIYAFFRISLNRKLNKKFETIRAAGQPVSLGELNEFYSIPFDVENSANIILDALIYYKEPNDLELIPVMGNAELPAGTDSMDEETREIILEFLAKNKESLELLHSTAGLKYGRYPVDFTLGIDTILPHLSELRKCSQMLALESVIAAENNEPNISFEAFKSICGVASSLNKEPALISQLIRGVCQDIAIESLEYSINRISFSGEQLDEIMILLDEIADSNGTVYAFCGERCMTLDTILHPEPMYFSLSSTRNTIWSFPPALLIYKSMGLNKKDALKSLSFTEESIGILNLPIEQRYNAAKVLNAELSNIPKENVLLRCFIPALGNYIISDLRYLNKVNISRVAIAVERFRLKNNKLPESLSNLVPDYIDSIPMDPYDGEELKYKLLDKGFVIYSIGEDLVDDGGTEKPKDNKQGSKPTYDISFIIEK